MSSTTTGNSTVTVPEATAVNLCERVWRMIGFSVVLFFVAAYLVYGSQP